MLDDEDITKLSLLLATKGDLESLATKKDLEGVATKKDLENMADSSLKIFANKQDVQEIKSDLADLKELLQGLLVASDKMLKSMEILGAEYKAMSVQLTRHEKWIKQLSEKLGMQLSFE